VSPELPGKRVETDAALGGEPAARTAERSTPAPEASALPGFAGKGEAPGSDSSDSKAALAGPPEQPQGPEGERVAATQDTPDAEPLTLPGRPAVSDVLQQPEKLDVAAPPKERSVSDHSGAEKPTTPETHVRAVRAAAPDAVAAQASESRLPEGGSETGERPEAVCAKPHQAKPAEKTSQPSKRPVAPAETGEIPSMPRPNEALDPRQELGQGSHPAVASRAEMAGARRVRTEVSEETDEELSGRQQVRPTDESTMVDPLTGLANRKGLERALAQWCQEDPYRIRPLCAAMIDLDHFARLNERHGYQVGDRILRAVAQVLISEGRKGDLPARYGGQRFAVLLFDVDLRTAGIVVERMRQTLGATRFQLQDREIRATVSCAVLSAMSEETLESLWSRAEATLAEAKRYGRNRTFMHDGVYPAPVVPPDLELEEKVLAL